MRCPQCGSTNVRFREKRNNWICDDCDFVFTIEDVAIDSTNEKTGKNKGRIFISYGHDCKTIVLRIKKDLETIGYDVWLDDFEIKSGDDWRNTIVEGILGSQVVLAFLSVHALRQGGVCLDELAIAVGCNRSIIRTCLMDSDAIQFIPPTINGIEYVDMTQWKSMDGNALEQWYQQKFLEINKNIESALLLQQDPMIKELEYRLHPCLAFDNQFYELRKSYTQREWLSRQVDDWIEDERSRLLVMTAYPGGGKSSFCAHYFHYHPLSVCLTMCEQNVEGEDETCLILRNIAFQIAKSSIGYRKNLLWTLNNQAQSFEEMDAQTLFNLLICIPFQLEIDGNHSQLIIVIDGIDVLDNGERNNLANLFSQNMSKLPDYISVMFSTRHSFSVMNSFPNTSRINIDPLGKETRDDLERFIQEHLPDLSEKRRRMIANRCRGSFLYASFLATTIKEGLVETSEKVVMSPQMESMYYHAMCRIFPHEEDYKAYWHPIALIIASGGEMPIKLLSEYMGWLPHEFNRFYSRLMTFLQRRVDTKGGQWVGVVYPSFISWITEGKEYNVFCTPMELAIRELSNLIWEKHSNGQELSDFELLQIRGLLLKDNVDGRFAELGQDGLFMHQILTRIKERESDPRNYQLIQSLMDFCQEIASRVNTKEAVQISRGELPYLKIRQDFVSSNYNAVTRRYESHQEDLERYCSQVQSMDLLYMASTSYDLIGNRQRAIAGFSQLYEDAQQSQSYLYEFYAIVGLLWNDHFTNLKEGLDLVDRLGKLDTICLGEREKLLQRLILARFKLSMGEIDEAFNDFMDVVSVDSGLIWGYNSVSSRIQMLLIESLVAAYDNCNYVKGVELGKYIYAHIGESIGIPSCYCASWLVMNSMQCGELEEAERLLLKAENKNEQLNKIGPSDWMSMHLKSVRSKLYAMTSKTDLSVAMLNEVVGLAIETNDIWVLGDAYFDLFCLAWFSDYSLLSKDALLDLYGKLKELADVSQLPHLRYKTIVMGNVLLPNREGAMELLSETKQLIMKNALASMDHITALYLCWYVYGLFFQGSKEHEMLKDAIVQEARSIDQKNPGIGFSKRNRIVQLLSNKND